MAMDAETRRLANETGRELLQSIKAALRGVSGIGGPHLELAQAYATVVGAIPGDSPSAASAGAATKAASSG